VPRRAQVSDDGLIRRIRALAAVLARVSATRSSVEFMVSAGLTVSAVCAGLCEYLDAGRPVDEVVTEATHGHIGEPMYELHPTIEVQDFYVKIRLIGRAPREALLLVSVHF
jgi:hypothetical protein